MKITNEKMAYYIEVLSGLSETGKLGYAIARNSRKLREAATEYLEMRQKVFEEYGTIKDDGTAEIKTSVFREQMGDIGQIEHDVDIYQVDEDTFTSGSLTSKEMEQLMWMVE